MRRACFFPVLFLLIFAACQPVPTESSEPSAAQPSTEVIAYFAGGIDQINQYDLSELTQIIYSFCHLQGNELAVDNAEDSLTIRHLVSLKAQHPNLKVLLSLGGWGGCETCSEVFSKEEGRLAFASSVKRLSETYGTDGLDLDWEYPAIEGYPGHQFLDEDRPNFTALVKTLRDTLGPEAELSFAAAGFKHFFDNSVEWDQIMPLLNRVNIMSYDLVSGFSKTTGHHTPLYSQTGNIRSADHAVRYLDSLGVPRNKMVIGAAFYARVWENVSAENNGLFQAGDFKQAIGYRRFDELIHPDSGFVFHWDEAAQAPYAYHPEEQWFATFDDPKSVAAKAKYAQEQDLNGIMFWQLANDRYQEGLLEALTDAVK
ncbi:MAG: glycoside hydrolase family 18 protein [Bacteroidota bacterium]